MRALTALLASLLLTVPGLLAAAELSRSAPHPFYLWSSSPVGQTAELLTLSCHACMQRDADSPDVPLIAVLRDTLGDRSSDNNRVLYMWLLTARRNGIADNLLSAVPFFYWHIGNGAQPHGTPSPLLNLNAPLHPVLSNASRKLLQWTALDPLSTAVRASSHSYQANALEGERIKLEQAITYLQSAPLQTNGIGLTDEERNTVVARLVLKKSFLGGLISDRNAGRLGEQTTLASERIRSHNLEILRQWAEKTGTYLEPLTLAGTSGEFAMLWFPVGAQEPGAGSTSKSFYKLLNIRNPWSDPRITHWSGPFYQRPIDANRSLLPAGGDQSVTLIPLAVYSLDYSRMPLLLADFRDKQQVRRHEMLQRSITEITSGVIGISYLANWYYYAGAIVYNTVWARRGTASNQAERLDSYARFRTHLALDNQLDPTLHSLISARAESVFVNPLTPDLAHSLRNAQAESDQLQQAARNGTLLARLNSERRAELAHFDQSVTRQTTGSALHVLSFGAYTDRVPPDQLDLVRLDRNRRINRQLDLLNEMTRNGTNPEVAFDGSRIARSIHELNDLLPDLDSQPVREHAAATLTRVRSLTSNPILQAECLELLNAVNAHQAIASVVAPK